MKNCNNKNYCILNGAWDEIYVRNWECDTEMSDTSVRPVQNKVIKQYVDEKFKELSIGGVEQYPSESLFPETGIEKSLYYAIDSESAFVWDKSALKYVKISGSDDVDIIEINGGTPNSP
uniref:Uncharacterized protein n=1 Tax=Siphoviridae sp. ctnpt50 TaxID=2827941 RepID=A0A8S5SEA3_9CAUD|nr:MAG TPA: hypothetical protein [Siphoviridae sp. ctnpt50]